MRQSHYFRRTAGALAGLWDKIPDLCEHQGCRYKPIYRNRLADGRVAFTCGRHTPEEFRQHRIT